MSQEHEPLGFRKWLPLVAMSLALAIIVIDNTVLNVSLNNILADLNIGLKEFQWTTTLYSLILTAFTIAGGRLGDILGRKKMFMVGAALFGVGSLVASFAQDLTVLILGWSVLEGIGAALMLPATTSLLVSNYTGKDRGLAFGIWGATAGASAAFGPIVGGWLTTFASWHWAFRINVFIVLLLLAVSWVIKEAVDTKEKPQLDFGGVVLSAVGLGSVVYGIIESGTYGWLMAKKPWEVFGNTVALPFDISITFYALIVGFVFLALFAWWQNKREQSGKTPLMSLSILQNRTFVSGLLITSALALGIAGLTFSIPIFYQRVQELSAFDTGLGLLPMSLTMIVAAPTAAILARRIRARYMIQAGLIIAGVGILVLRNSLSLDSNVWSLAPGLILFALGMGTMQSVVSNVTLSAVNVNQAGEASGVNATSRQLGQTLGAAIIGTVFLTTFTSSFVNGVNSNNRIPGPAKSFITSQIENNEGQTEFNNNTQNAPQAMVDEISNISHQAIVSGGKEALLYTSYFIAAALVVTFFLPHKKNQETSGQPKMQAQTAH